MRARPTADAGFTLVELLITTVIVGIVTFSVGTSMLIGLRTTFETGERLAQSNNSQQLGQYLLPDVASAAPGGVAVSSSAGTGCSGTAPAGSNVLALEWADVVTGASVRSSYRYEAPLLARYACTGGGAPTRTVVLRSLLSTPVVTTASSAVVMTATVEQEQADGGDYTFSVRATRRTPSTVCEPEPTSIAVSPVPVAASGGSTSSPLTVTFVTSGPCTAAQVQYEHDATSSLRTASATSSGTGNWSATIPAGSGWTTGSKDLYVRAGGLSASTTFLVFDPNACTLAGGPTATPDPADRVGTALLTPVVVSWTTSGSCSSSGSLTFQHGTAGTDVTTVAATRSGSTWAATAPAVLPPGASWTDGTKSYSVNGDVATGSGTFRVQPGAICALLTDPVPDPASVALTLGHVDSGKRITGPVRVTFTAEPSCTTASVDYTYDGGTAVANVAATLSAGVWTATIPAVAPGTGSWTTGTKTLTARSGAASRGGSLTVTRGCGVVGALAFTPSKGKLGPSGSQLAAEVKVSFTSSNGCSAADFRLRYQHGSTAAESSNALVSGSGTTWTATLPQNPPGGSARWSAGNKPVTVTVGASGDDVVTTATLVVDP